ncbi:hypothetical protein [Halanaerobacter jeridensis]|uniref:Uncharacterized protein n=1 Tax=Halanaerobacter jeridensis TaxID=706427 RepID=A0A938XY07_9FIRM|nr:hypothetical protein [Halanaerobacter jeridensis]MBM7557747.1 hypothetical protein [Halanaerobacter jeridensis]
MKIHKLSFIELGLLLSLVIILVVIIYKVSGGNLEYLLSDLLGILTFN